MEGGGVIVRRQPCPPARPIFYYNIHEINTSMYGSVPFKHSVVRLSRPNHTHTRTHAHLHTHPGADQGIPETGGGGQGPRKGRSVGIFKLEYAQQESGLHCMPPGGRTSPNHLGKRRVINQYNPRI